MIMYLSPVTVVLRARPTSATISAFSCASLSATAPCFLRSATVVPGFAVLAGLGARRVPDRRAPGALLERRRHDVGRRDAELARPGSWSSAASGSRARARSRRRAGSDRTRDRSTPSSARPRRSCSCRSPSRRPPCCRSAARRRSTCRACGRPPRRRRRSSRSSGRSCVQPLTIWMRSRLPDVGSFTAQTMNVGALPLAGGRSPPIGTPFA